MLYANLESRVTNLLHRQKDLRVKEIHNANKLIYYRTVIQKFKFNEFQNTRTNKFKEAKG